MREDAEAPKGANTRHTLLCAGTTALTVIAAVPGWRPGPGGAHSRKHRGTGPSPGWSLKEKGILEPLGLLISNALF